MKLIKVDGYWIVISKNSIITNKDFYLHKNQIKQFLNSGYDGINFIKLIASRNPEHNLPTIKFSDKAAKELGVVDVEELSKQDSYKLLEGETGKQYYFSKGFTEGYNRCLSDNVEKKYTDLDVYDYPEWLIDNEYYNYKSLDDSSRRVLFDKYLQSLTKQEYEVELEMEAAVFGNHTNFNKELDDYERPKITDNSVTIIKILV